MKICVVHIDGEIDFYLGCRDKRIGKILKKLIETDYLHVTVVDDAETVEVCGALKVCLKNSKIQLTKALKFANVHLGHCGCRNWFHRRPGIRR